MVKHFLKFPGMKRRWYIFRMWSTCRASRNV